MYATAVRSEPHGDEQYQEYSRAELLALQRRTDELTAQRVTDPAWWNARLEGVNAITAELPGQLARMVGNLAQACRGETTGIDAITASLSILLKQARADAATEARDQAEAEMSKGTL